MNLPLLRANLDIMVSPIPDQPGLLIRDSFRYSDAVLIIPPFFVQNLSMFDGQHTDSDLKTALAYSFEIPEANEIATQLVQTLSDAGFLENETYAKLKEQCHTNFAESPVREAAHAGSSYPAELDPLRVTMQRYLGSSRGRQEGLIGIAAPHISPEGGWKCYRAAYKFLTPDLRDRTFVVLGTSHYGQPDKFGLTRKPFETPFGRTTIDQKLVDELAFQRAAVMEDYCHAIEHSIEFQVVFLQAIYGASVRIVPILCGSFGKHADEGKYPEDDEDVMQFIESLGKIAAREKDRLFWVLGVDMAHMGRRYGDEFAAHANRDEMTSVRERDKLRIDTVKSCDSRGFWDHVQENRDDLKWCGSSPIYTFMKAVPRAKGTLRRYEQWNIDEQSVVTFAGISFQRD